jgi:hypothetical protein
MPRGSGYASIGPIKSLERTAEYYEAKARVIRDAIAVFLEHRENGKRKSAGSMFGEAVAVDRARAATQPSTAPYAQPDYHKPEKIAARRKASADLLATFSSTPRPIEPGGEGRKVAPLIRRGYLRKKGAGYVRTAKQYSIKP